MKKTILILLFVSLFAASCEKSGQSKVTYLSTNAISAYNLQYMTAEGSLQEEVVNPESAQDQWRFEYMASEGDIVYISGNYNDEQSALQIKILIDGKVYKQASNQGDTLKYLTVSGSIPYKD